MKTPISVTWIAPLMVLVACSPDAPAQSKTNLPQGVRSEPQTTQTPAGLPSEPAALAAIMASDLSPQPVLVGAKINPPQGRVPPSNLTLSPWTSEIIKLAEAGIEDSVVFSFIENSGMFNLGADQIIYLNDLGVASPIVAAMLQHDSEVALGVRTLTISSEPALKLEWPKGFLTRNAAPVGSRKTTAAFPAPATVATAQVLSDSPGTPSLEVASSPPSFSATTVKFDMAQETAAGQVRAPANTTSAYPVRESHSVELLPPIIFINEVPRTPNTIVIVGFPEGTR